MIRQIFIGLIRAYQVGISPLLGANCRYYPTCSAYALEAFERYGVLKGFKLTLTRLLRCHPLQSGGYDPVP
ncbi:MAG: membrane protein insertion efficiency factor YidD [Gemmatimonadaceae bacterium]